MKRRLLVRGGLISVLFAGFFAAVPLWGYASGQIVPCNGCHTPTGGSPSAVSISAPAYMNLSQSTTIIVTVGPSAGHSAAGFWLSSNTGSFSTGDAGIGIYGLEVYHTTPRALPASFSVTYTAPGTLGETSSGTIPLSAWGNAVNLSGSSSGDYPVQAPSATVSICQDADGDGAFASGSGPNCPGTRDCNDGNGAIRPGATETCDNQDNNCSGNTDEGCDDDGDKYCDWNMTRVGTPTACNLGGGDCNDGNGAIRPGATETCDNQDNNCNGNIDESCDDDNDNYCDSGMTTVGAPSTCTAGGNDCNDNNGAIRPGLTESCNNVDDNCSGLADEGCDNDGDNYCDSSMSYVGSSECPNGQGDCNDDVLAIRPGASEICDNQDNNCANGTDEGCDDDNDNYCDSGITKATNVAVSTCPNTPSSASVGNDCNDNAGSIFPGASEVCNNADESCNGINDDGCDDDGDDYCDSGMSKAVGVTVSACPLTTNGASAGNDCNDSQASVFPNSAEICDGLDNNCNGPVDDNISNLTCGLGICQAVASGCVGGVPQSCTPGQPQTETCGNTGTDNDCDGNAAELNNNVFANDACTVSGAQGVCALGARACSGSTLVCQPTTSSSSESCSNPGTDNDCDGNAAELNNGIFDGDVCSVSGQTGICVPGTYHCNGTNLGCLGNFVPGQISETCTNTGTDNDCDGDVSEIANGIHTGDVCNTGQAGVCSTGKYSCSAGSLICIGDVAPGTRGEVCDGLDNDCDATADNNLPALTCGIGACQRTVPACQGGGNNTCTPLPSSTEICDGLDNDCDESTDEDCDDDNDGFCDASMTTIGAPATCASGGGDCDDTHAASYPGAIELCDGEDNDCDTTPDDDITIVTCGLGECTRQAQGCENGEPIGCTPGTPENEVCDDLDNDCDGSIDEELKIASCGKGICKTTGSGCAASTCDPLPAAVEICDGLDNDCDGTADEIEEIPLSTCGSGQCARTGATCAPESCEIGTPLAEVCDGFDNDCNGVPDDGLPAAVCGTGECQAIGGSCLPSSCQPGVPAAEVCDGLDNDCDGVIDNGCDDDNDGFCDSNLPFAASPLCENGEGDCDDSFADSHPGAFELCDGSDNNCDGELDNNIETDNIHCGVGACVSAGTSCENGVATDCVPHESSDEICDGVDNNCDGVVDEGLGELACGVGECKMIVTACNNGQEKSCSPGEPSDEQCDGLDNDCDGVVDNDAPCATGVCVVGQCVVLDANGDDPNSPSDPDAGEGLDDLEGPGEALPPPDDDDSTGDEDEEEEEEDELAPNERGICSWRSGPAPPSHATSVLLALLLAGAAYQRRLSRATHERRGNA